jgi:ring-1,2-phenylacetyl-CoA epoxidase subunit PaaD
VSWHVEGEGGNREVPPAEVLGGAEASTEEEGGSRGKHGFTRGRELKASDVWSALAEIPDPEIPVISLVELGVVRDVHVRDGRVQVDFTPTFLGCPALEVMRDAMAERIRSLGAEPEVRVLTGDSWSTDRITPEGREKLRESGFAPPAPRETGPPTLVQLESNGFRCPYCGSRDTALENIFGPTPCRSLRYCRSCRQPFEQFKTI